MGCCYDIGVVSVWVSKSVVENGGPMGRAHARGAEHRESIMHFEMDRPLRDEELESLREAVLRVLTDVVG